MMVERSSRVVVTVSPVADRVVMEVVVGRSDAKLDLRDGLVLMTVKMGRSPTTAAGEPLSVDYMLPVSLIPELALRFFNLEILTAEENLSKGARTGEREKELARRWHALGLLSAEGLSAID